MSSEYLEEVLLRANELAVGTAAGEARLQAILASVDEAVITVDVDGCIESTNRAAERLFGLSSQRQLGRLITEFIPDLRVGPRVRIGTRETESRRVDGTSVCIELTLSHIEVPDGQLLLLVARDISERKAANAELERLASTDSLTGLANRYRGARELELLLVLAARQHLPVAVSLLDLDHFKQFNDGYGHPIGDEVLRRLGMVLLELFRKSDVVARWGGEEFLIGLYDSNKVDAARRIQLVQDSLRRQNITLPDGGVANATFSAGVAEFPADGRSVGDLYRTADRALYLAKAAGRTCILLTP